MTRKSDGAGVDPRNLPNVGPNQYRCDACGGVFDKGWSDDEAAAELSENFPGFTPEDSGIVCDSCYKQMGFQT